MRTWFPPETNGRNASLVERRSHKVIGFTAPEPETNEEFGTEEMIVEVRGNRLCTVFPRSVYVSDEAIAFDDRDDNCQSTWSYSKPVYRDHATNWSSARDPN